MAEENTEWVGIDSPSIKRTERHHFHDLCDCWYSPNLGTDIHQCHLDRDHEGMCRCKCGFEWEGKKR